MLLLAFSIGCFTDTAPPPADVAALAARLDEQEGRIALLEEELATAADDVVQLRADLTAAEETIGGLEADLASADAELASLATMIRVEDGDLVIGHADHRGSVLPERVTDHDVIIAGANLFVVNGEGDTATANQRGNLILGYSEAGIDPEHTLEGWDESADLAARRGGSHNLVVGPRHGYTAWGSVLVGSDNRAEAVGAVVVGRRNLASQEWTAGALHDAAGNLVVGGDNRAVDADFGVSVGGNSNWVTGQNDAIFGGSTNQPNAGGVNRTYIGAHNAVSYYESFSTVVGGGQSILYCDDAVYP